MDKQKRHFEPDPTPGQTPEARAAGLNKLLRQKAQRLEEELLNCRQQVRDQEEELRRLHEQLAASHSRPPDQPDSGAAEKHHKLITRILETSPAAIVMINPHGQVTFANSRGVKLMGLRQDQSVFQPSRDPGWIFTDFAGQNILKEDSPLIKVLVDQRPIYQVPVALRHVDGRCRYYLVNGAPMFDRNGHLEGAVISAEDITPLKQTEEALNAAHARLEHLFAAGPAVIYSCVIQWDYSSSPVPTFMPDYLSANFAAKFGYETEEIVGDVHFWINHMHPEDADKILAANHTLMATGHIQYEYRFRHRDGKYLWVYDEKRLIPDGSGIPREVIGYLTDITHRKTMEEELTAAKARLEHLITASSAVIYSCQAIPPYAPSYVSENLKDILGYSTKEFLSIPNLWADSIHPADAPRVFSSLASLADHKRLSLEYRFRSRSGDYLWIQDEMTLVDSRSGLSEIVGFWMDISQRKQTEEILRETQERLSTLINSTPDPIFFKDVQGRYLLINQAYQKGDWFQGQDWFGKTDMELFPDHTARIFMKSDAMIVSEHRSALMEYTLKNPRGSKVIYQTIKFPLFNEQGLVIGIGGIARDITARKEMEQLLKRSEANLQALFDTVQDFIWVLDKKGRFIRVNSVALKLLGYSQEELVGQSVHTIYPPDCREQASTLMADLMAGNIDECSLPLQSKDGSQIPVETKVTRGQWFGTEVLIGISRDVTVRRQLEAQLIKSAKIASLGVMAGGIAHEIRSPLTVCSSAAQFLLEENLDADFRRLCLEKMLAGVAQASAIVENLLKYARTPEKLETSLINLQEVIQDSLALVASQARMQNVAVRKVMPNEPVSFYAMPGLLTQAFLNLFLNALKAMPEGGCLTLTLERDDQDAVITIADTGHGIAVADLPNIFDPFYTTQGVGQGTGLGLAICQSFIKQHHGSIEVDSNLGQGATFIIRLPLASPTTERLVREK